MKTIVRILSRAVPSVLVTAVAASVVVGQQTLPSDEVVTVLRGAWAGRIGDAVRGQDVLSGASIRRRLASLQDSWDRPQQG